MSEIGCKLGKENVFLFFYSLRKESSWKYSSEEEESALCVVFPW